MDIGGRSGIGPAGKLLAITVHGLKRGGHRLHQRHAMQIDQQLGEHALAIGTLRCQGLDRLQHLGRIRG